MRRITNQEAAKSLGTDVESLKKQLQGKKKRNEASVKALPEINNDEVIKRRIRDLTTPNGWIRKLTQEELGIFTETVLTAVNRTPVFREGFALLSPFVDATAETCYTDKHARVGLSYRFLYALDPSTRATWLTHEVMHLLNNHFTRFATAGVRAARANIVGDLEINTCLHANRTMTTSHMLLPQDYDLKKFKTMEWYNANWNAQLDQILSRDESRMQQSDASSSPSSPSQDSGSGDQSSSAEDDGSLPDQMSSGGGSGDSDSDSQEQQSQNDSGGSGSGSSSGSQQSSESSQGAGGSSQSQSDEWSDPSDSGGSGQSQSGSSSSQSQGSSGSGSGSQSDDSDSGDGSQQGDGGSSSSSQNGNNDGGDTDSSSSQRGNNSNDAGSGSSQDDADSDQSQNGSGNGGQQEDDGDDNEQSGNSGGGSSSKKKRRGSRIQLGSGTDFSSLGPKSGGSNSQQPNSNDSGSGGGSGDQQGYPSGDGGGSAGDGQQSDGGQSGNGSGSSGQSSQNQGQDSDSEGDSGDGQNQQSDKISESNDRLAEDMKSKNTTGPSEKSMTCDTPNDLREQAADAAGIERKSSATQAAARDSVRTRIVQDQNSRNQSSDGSGDEFLMLALKLMGTPKVKWQTILRQSIAKAYGEIMAGKTIRTYRRPNRRFGGGKNQPIFRGSSAIKPTVMIGIDSSGSMSNPDFSAAITEVVSIIKGASKTKGGVEMFCIDTDVKSIEVVNNVNKLNLSGGGGTWMHSGFEFIKSLPNKKQPDIFILATDGYLADEDWEQIYHTVTDPSTKFKTVILITQKESYKNCPMKLKQATTVIDIHTEKYND